MAHALTGLRLLLAAPVAFGVARPEAVPASALAVLLAVAIGSDYFDGVAARRFATASPRGRLFDHATDFVFVTAGLAAAAAAGLVPVALPALIAAAFTQYVLDSYLLHREKQLRMSVLGRLNGILYFVPLLAVSASRLDPAAERAEQWQAAVSVLSYALIVSTVVSIADRAAAPRARPATG